MSRARSSRAKLHVLRARPGAERIRRAPGAGTATVIPGRLHQLGLILLSALALAGCESDQRAALEERRSAAATPTPTPTPSPPPASEDDRRVEDAAIRLEDVPQGWREDELEGDIASCQQIVNARTRATGSARSPALGDDTGTFAQSWVFLYADDAIAEQTYVDLARDDTRACVAEALMQAAGDAAETYDAEPFRADALGEDNEAGRMTIHLDPSSGLSALVLDVRFALSGRGVAMMLFVGLNEPFDEDLRLNLVDALAARFKAALE